MPPPLTAAARYCPVLSEAIEYQLVPAGADDCDQVLPPDDDVYMSLLITAARYVPVLSEAIEYQLAEGADVFVQLLPPDDDEYMFPGQH